MRATGGKLRSVFTRTLAPITERTPNTPPTSAHDPDPARAEESPNDDISSTRSSASTATAATPTHPTNPTQPACVIEIFTTDVTRAGRSVDDVLAKLVASQAGSATSTTVLVFHVDASDTTEARDSLGSSAFSARQKMYSRVFRCEAFTPMAVVNGRNAVIAANVLTVRLAIAAARRKANNSYNAAYVGTNVTPPSISLSLETTSKMHPKNIDCSAAAPTGTPVYRLTHRINALPSRSILHLAVVQNQMVVAAPKHHADAELGTAMEKGPGRLVHNAVVRGFLTFFVDAGDSEDHLPVTFAFPGAELHRMKVFAYLSPEDDTRIIASAEVPFLEALDDTTSDASSTPHHLSDSRNTQPTTEDISELKLIS